MYGISALHWPYNTIQRPTIKGKMMSPKNRVHIDELPTGGLAPKHISKQEFGRRIYRELMARGWNQSELARQTGLPRDSVSTYVRGVSLPTPKSLQKLADAFGTTPADLLPNSIEAAIEEDVPSLEMKVSVSAPSTAWLRVNRLVSLSTAARVIELVEADALAQNTAVNDGAPDAG